MYMRLTFYAFCFTIINITKLEEVRKRNAKNKHKIIENATLLTHKSED